MGQVFWLHWMEAFSYVLGESQGLEFKSLDKKDFYSVLNQENRYICNPCLLGQAVVDENSWSLAGPDALSGS